MTREILTVNGDIDDISAGGSSREHACGGNTSSVVRVDVDGQIGGLLPDSSNESATQSRISI